jgi:hypothetical protein
MGWLYGNSAKLHTRWIYKNKLRGPKSASELYRATATCRWNLVLTFVDRGVSRGQHSGSPTVVNLSSLDRDEYIYPSKILTVYSSHIHEICKIKVCTVNKQALTYNTGYNCHRYVQNLELLCNRKPLAAICMIWGFQSNGYEECGVLGCNVM